RDAIEIEEERRAREQREARRAMELEDERWTREREAMRKEERRPSLLESGSEVEIRLDDEEMESQDEETPLQHPSIVRLNVDSRQPSIERQSSVASDDLDRSSLLKLKLENNLERATTSHGEREGEKLNTEDVERFWEYRYNKSPRTMKELEEAKHRAAVKDAERHFDREIRKRIGEKDDDEVDLDEEMNRKLTEAERRFLPRAQQEQAPRFDDSRSSLSSPSIIVGRLTPEQVVYEAYTEEESERCIPLVSPTSRDFFHLRSSSSSSASSFNSMGDGRQGRVSSGASRLTRDARSVGGALAATGNDLERLYPYIRHSSYYLNYYRTENLSVEKHSAPRNGYMLSRGLHRSSSTRDGMMRQSVSSDYIKDEGTGRKNVSFRHRVEELVHTPPTINRRLRSSATVHVRPILKHASNFLKVANENMLRELEQCVEERDRLSVNINATPADVSQLSPMTQSAQTRYRNHMVDQKERISVLIETKYTLIKETLREDDMPSWMRGKEDSIELTLVDHKRPHRRLFRRQSSSFFYQQQSPKTGYGSRGADLVTANECARKLERLKSQITRRDSEAQIDYDDNAGDLLSRITQRLSTSPIRMD
ncbi:hypothetical protein PMAYCL1PPCAC_20345, partial [Pristionchus mayeri]